MVLSFLTVFLFSCLAAASGGDGAPTPSEPSSAPSVRTNGMLSVPSKASSIQSSNANQRTEISSPNTSARVVIINPGAKGETSSSSRQATSHTNPSKSGLASEKSPIFERSAPKARSQKRIAAYCTALESIEASAEPVELESDERELIP